MKDLQLFYELRYSKNIYSSSCSASSVPPQSLLLPSLHYRYPGNFVPNKQDLISLEAAAHTGCTSSL